MRYALGFSAFCLLAACGAPEQFVAAPKIEAQARIPSQFASLEVVEVSLPTYAARTEITANKGGQLVLSETQWADDPARAMTLSLTRHLSEITRARVASEPWPFDGSPSGRVEVRVEELIVTAGLLRMSGQYYVVDLDDRGRNHAHLFDLSTPVGDYTATAFARGRAVILLKLANEIAADGL